MQQITLKDMHVPNGSSDMGASEAVVMCDNLLLVVEA